MFTTPVPYQSGSPSSRTTTTSLLADVLEKQWAKLREDSREAIAKNAEAINKIDTSKFEKEIDEKKAKTRKSKYQCPKCDYKTNFLHKIEVHKSVIHKSKLALTKKGKRSFYDSDDKEDDSKRTKEEGKGQGPNGALVQGPSSNQYRGQVESLHRG